MEEENGGEKMAPYTLGDGRMAIGLKVSSMSCSQITFIRFTMSNMVKKRMR
jgi:hypothetical protein